MYRLRLLSHSKLFTRDTVDLLWINQSYASVCHKPYLPLTLSLSRHTNPVRNKKEIIPIARDLGNLGFGLMATTGTATTLRDAGVPCEIVLKIHEGRPNPMDVMK